MAILSIDQGTTGTTCMIYDRTGSVLARAYRELTQHYPQAGWVEHDPEEIWRTVVECVAEVRGAYSGHIEAIGITNQRETTVVWDRRSGQPVHRAIVWQCRRTAKLCNRYRSEEAAIRAKTGLPVDAYFSATKIRWILDAHPEIDPSNLLFGTIDTWLIWKLTGGEVHATDLTNASRTLLFDIHERRWSPELCELFGVPLSMLPEARPSMGGFGSVRTIPALDGVLIAGVAGDQQAALFGQCCFAPGSVKNTYGTGCFMVMNTGEKFVSSSHGLLTTLALDGAGRSCYAVEGSVFIGGAVMQWLRDGLQLIGSAAESETIARSVESNGGVYLVPAFVGLGAPHWNMEARGTITGLTRGSSRAHIVRAALESIAFQSHDVFRAMVADIGIQPQSLTVDGGAVSNEFLMQLQADLLGVPVHRPRNIESTALGAACLAGLEAGVWGSAAELRVLNSVERVFTPAMPEGEREALLAGWQKALRQTLTS
ncbi:MAG TPA: glycerol kinase [Chlorobaculum sp.]|uniref:Glycerol kinase n=1 Tax=Chlorobaculum tepidum (strain ATCC 49652 / DSM 12025 / NBRC 103806 / TLS) TaxID=194439 RepID=Q8KFY5_CHLTE|nr:glycerol kinase GlpK [Chlorobaculum tepidum]AAM71433.1 glycerol kinase [Chlorobaculum tepidum TLS]HBU23661.1 glycerol kinase [Chlorobaculum sp.]